jgi:hypothetical protein
MAHLLAGVPLAVLGEGLASFVVDFDSEAQQDAEAPALALILG